MTAALRPPRPPPFRLSLAVQYAITARSLPSRAHFRKWVRAALEHDAIVTLRIVGQEEGRVLNRNYRKKDYATNVLTFVFRDHAPFEGDLALCAPVVASEARAQKKTLAMHYAHLTVHGMLHLQGYDHENDKDALVMERREAQIMAKLGYADPYQAVQPKRTR
jgi:probable rRNA maturation factor